MIFVRDEVEGRFVVKLLIHVDSDWVIPSYTDGSVAKLYWTCL